MRSPHCRYMNASQMQDPALVQPQSWFVRMVYRVWPEQRSVIGMTVSGARPAVAASVSAGNLYEALYGREVES